MSFAAQITRLPRPFEPDRADEVRARFDDLAPELRDLLANTAGCSPYLRGSIEREEEWLRGAMAQAPQDVLEALLRDAARASDLMPELRRAKRRLALLVALADLGGIWPLEAVTGALTRFADACVQRVLVRLTEAQVARGTLPAAPGDEGRAAGQVILAMGKMGAHELNYSSDIDLICLYDDALYAGDDQGALRAVFVGIIRKLTAILSQVTAEGYVFRTDLRLRPDASVTPVCIAMSVAERYYESLGRTWERGAYIKARPCAGALAAGERFLQHLTPFVWRRHLDFAAIQDAHDMRLRIRAHKQLHGPITPEGHDIKLGAGGIREIEFYTQTRQIIAGGRDSSLRVRGTCEGLARLQAKGWTRDAEVLSEHYAVFREVEHRVQMIADQQTHVVPASPEGFARLAAFMDRDAQDLRADLLARLREVDALTEGFFAPEPAAGRAVALEAEAALGAAGRRILERWPSYPALRSARAVEIFRRLEPELLARIARTARPDETLGHFDGFLAGLPAGVQVFSLFEANPQLLDLIIDIASSAPELAVYLARNAGVLDQVIGGAFFAALPQAEALVQDLADVLRTGPDYERRLDAARRWMKDWHFRIGVHFLRGLIDADTAGAHYADLAQAVVAGLLPHVLAEFARKHGAAPGAGAVVLGMGSLGARALSARSDLDLIVIYDPDGVETSDGPRPLPTRTYYARLTQALVTALSAPMAEGRLYEVDMRLRPSGRQGPVATSFPAFTAYQRDEAWTWEHLALTRARVVAGAPALSDKIETFRRTLLETECDRAKVLADLADMRRRLGAAKPGAATLEVKDGPGGLQDIALLAQAGALLAASPAHETAAQLAAGAEALGLGAAERDALAAIHGRLWSLQARLRLLFSGAPDIEQLSADGCAFVLRESGASDIAEVTTRSRADKAQAARIMDELLAPYAGTDKDGHDEPE